MLHIHRAERADGLADALGELLAAPLDDPFAPEVVSVPTRGMERWLSQRLSASLGASPRRIFRGTIVVKSLSPKNSFRSAIT